MTRRRRMLVAVAGVMITAAIASGVVIAARRLTAPLPALTVAARVSPALVVAAGPPPPIPAPANGSLEVATDADGVLAAAGAELTRPIGSVAKTMTALVVLRQRPLDPGTGGPVLTMTGADVTLYREAVAQQGSTIPVALGERLDERQLLLALLLPSANNIAETLARWVAGSREAFIASLNAQAVALNMNHTHFADPSGYSPQTVSSAADLVILARAAIETPALLELVGTQTAALPDGLVLHNLDTLLASAPGWFGIKTGWTPQAGGCLLFAARQRYAPDTPPVTLVGAVLGQPPDPAVDPSHSELGGAFRVARTAATAALDGYTAVPAAAVHPSVTGAVTAPWGARAGLRTGAAGNSTLVLRYGEALAVRVSVRTPAPAARSGAVVGEVVATRGTTPLLRWPLVLDGDVSEPPWWWRLANG